jgi:site-specific recombinase XerD
MAQVETFGSKPSNGRRWNDYREFMPRPKSRCRAATRQDRTHVGDALTVREPAALVPAGLVEAAKRYAAASRSEATTRRAYEPDWQRFVAWCDEHGLDPLLASPAAVALYATHLAESGKSVATIRRALTSISQAHRLAGHESATRDPHVATVLAGIRRTRGTAQRQARPLLVEHVKLMVAAIFPDKRGIQDRAMLLLGHAGAFRRSELVALNVDDLEFVDEGLVVTVCRSKTDQEARGVRVGIPFGEHEATCPVRAVHSWINASRITDGALFRVVHRSGRVTLRRASNRAVSRLVKKLVAAIALDPSHYSGHSLRAGLATSAARAGKSERSIMRQGRWRSRAMVDRYVRMGSLFEENAAEKIGL